MRRPKSTLGSNSLPILILSGFSLILALSAIFALRFHITPHYGQQVQMASSHFVMGMFDRSMRHTITITAGEKPHFYQNNKLIHNGWQGLEQYLNTLDCANPSRVNIILVHDEAVSQGTTQRLIDLVLQHGFNCTLAARPAIP